MAKIDFVDTDNLPICPHCGKEMDKILKRDKGVLERHTFYMCPHCKKLLSIGYNLGY